MKRIPLDPLIILIIIAAIMGTIFPVHGTGADIAQWIVKGIVALLFFLYGARLETKETLEGLKNWRLNLLILSFTFIIFPLIGILLFPLKNIFGPELYAGILFLTLVPSTVQGSIVFTGIARGNVAAAIVSASTSNIVGVFITPLLAALLLSRDEGGISVNPSTFFAIFLQLLFPFILGQILRPWIKNLANKKGTRIIDRGTMVIVVYTAFSNGRTENIWSSVEWHQILGLCFFVIILLIFMLWLTRWVGFKLGFPLADVKVIQFCGTKKSLASGLPMAIVLFGAANMGLLILPLMLFHSIQLIICSQLAIRYGRNARE